MSRIKNRASQKYEKRMWKAMEMLTLYGTEEQKKFVEPLLIKAATRVHPSHKTRDSDASTFDEICIYCNHTDQVPGGLGKLALPCPKPGGKLRNIQ